MTLAKLLALLLALFHGDQDRVSDYILDKRPDIYAKLNPTPTPATRPTPKVGNEP